MLLIILLLGTLSSSYGRYIFRTHKTEGKYHNFRKVQPTFSIHGKQKCQPSYSKHSNYQRYSLRYLDMTYIINDKIPVFPGTTPFILTNVYIGPRPPVDWTFGNKYEINENYGTQLDAPIHFYRNGLKLHEVTFDKLHGPAVLIDISKRAAIDSEAMVMIDDILKWECKYGKIPDGSFVLMYSGWGQFWNNTNKFTGGPTVADLRFPGFSPEAAKWLVKNRPNINGVGVDTLSCECAPSCLREQKIHVAILERNKVCVEAIANMDKIPEYGAEIFALPAKIEGGGGSTAYVFSFWKDDRLYNSKH